MVLLVSFIHSLLRIAATISIFHYHVSGLYGFYEGEILAFAFPAFMYLSGFYSCHEPEKAVGWMLKRIKRIYLPYWIVCLAVIVSNSILNYKEMTLSTVAVLIAGGNFFLQSPLYVEVWFVTVIVMFYVSVFILLLVNNLYLRIVLGVMLVVCLALFKVSGEFIYWFCIGYGARWLMDVMASDNRFITRQVVMINVNQYAFKVQGYSYEFFLLHGSVLLFFVQIARFDFTNTFFAAFVVTAILSVFLQMLVQKMENVSKALALPAPG